MAGAAHAEAPDTQWQVVSSDQSTCYPMGEVFRMGSGPMNSPEDLQRMLPASTPDYTSPMTLKYNSGDTALFETREDGGKLYAQLLVKGRANCLQMLQAVKTHAQVTGERKRFVAAYEDYRAEVARDTLPVAKDPASSGKSAGSREIAGAQKRILNEDDLKHIVPYDGKVQPDQAPNNNANAGSDMWFIADGTHMLCLPIPMSGVKTAEEYWNNLGHPPLHRILPSGAETVVIPQDDNRMLLMYQSKYDCIRWLPVAAELDAEANR